MATHLTPSPTLPHWERLNRLNERISEFRQTLHRALPQQRAAALNELDRALERLWGEVQFEKLQCPASEAIDIMARTNFARADLLCLRRRWGV